MTIYETLEDAIKAIAGDMAKIKSKTRMRGGDINEAFLLELSDGQKVFMKTNSLSAKGMFGAEVIGLESLRSTKAIGIPKVLALGTDEQKEIAFLILEYLTGMPNTNYWEDFGHELAMMHKASQSTIKFGFPQNNYIGSTVQRNEEKKSWAEFYRENRLVPQIIMANRHFDMATRNKFDKLLDKLDDILRKPAFSSILHGDLWSGNVTCGPNGKAYLIDPAVYIGDYETDYAMTELFSRFPEVFYDAYNEVNPLEPGYIERRPVYHLYHMLNHLNLFGKVYLEEVKNILNTLV